MKKVLIIAHLLRASPRIPGMAKYLPEFGWQPVIVTAPYGQKTDGKLRIVETEYRETLGFWKRLFKLNPEVDEKIQIKKRLGIASQKSLIDFLLTRVGEVANYPDSDKGWKAYAIKTGSEIIAKEKVGAIISSSSPVTSHIVAKELKLRHKLPWVADLRDLWSQNHNYGYSPLRRLVDKRLELRTLSTADALVAVSQPWADKLGTLHKNKTYTITNGFDPDEMNVPPASLTPHFTITCTGTIHPDKQDVSRLFAALRDLIKEGVMNPKEVEVRLYKPEEGWLGEAAAKYELSDVVKQYGQVPRQIAVEKQRESQVLLVVNWEAGEGLASHQGKLFEYLAAQRPILSTGGLGNYLTERMLVETQAGRHAPTVADIKTSLQELYQEYKQRGYVSYKGDIGKIDRYSYREMAREFTAILDSLTNATIQQGKANER